MGDFKKLQVWQKAHELALETHATADKIRGRSYTSLRSQMVRAAASIDANIVEGSGQRSDREFIRFIDIAINSANELESHLIMARDLGALGASDFITLREQLVTIRKMLYGLRGRVQSTHASLSQQPTTRS
jgi:four helix bundle protein